ncbi:MAG TPA: ATP synthase subunit I [Bryobacteraceae bacterium]|nr:ATP synthase subunit I [Bryobacteraceae bacterium]
MSVALLLLAVAAGLALGVMFYGGLWMTVRALPAAPHPVVLTLCSLALRTAAVLAGLLLVTRGRWQNALACLVGFTAARAAVSRYWVKCT